MLTENDLAELRRIQNRIVADARRRRRLAHWRCFWTFPLGHRRNTLYVCMHCGHDASYGEPAVVTVRSHLHF